MAKRSMPKRKEDIIDETHVEAVEIEYTPKTTYGIVSGCTKLNVRKNPSKSAAVITEINAGDELVIDPGTSTNEWYKVFTASGIEGFCMKTFVTVK